MQIEVNLSTLILIAAGLVAFPVWRWIVWKLRFLELAKVTACEIAIAVKDGIIEVTGSLRDDEFPEVIDER